MQRKTNKSRHSPCKLVDLPVTHKDGNKVVFGLCLYALKKYTDFNNLALVLMILLDYLGIFTNTFSLYIPLLTIFSNAAMGLKPVV